ncbi:hydroxyacid dehydrogenase [Micromonospora sp. DR5-3]|uniref:hydroxyacid dehydrogenase n=1 Tax=unclassified Micromonospora TaxID=2617518 RepID=UPI001CA3277E|nr:MULTISPECIES: hydroxyacid dehydrogenase [unclassified Micromonospora]MCW3819140.1 hydroxyacid dehydrogenase [Micromonospora sp. DR5-3]
MTTLPGGYRPVTVVSVSAALRAQFFPDRIGDRLTTLTDATLIDDHAALTRDGLAPLLARAEVLVTSWGVPRLDAALLDRAPALRLVAHTGASVKPFVTPELFARGITVTQAGQGMARSVAEVALAFTLALLHQTPRFDHALHTGTSWRQAEQAPPRHEILGCPVGVVGASRTGRAYLELVRALGAEVSVYDPTLAAADAAALGARLVSLDELLAGSRIVALHAPTLPETRHLLGARELALLPDGAGLVNTARSWLVDEAALVAELSGGRIDAALDVYDEEPLPTGHPLRALPNVLLTPHQAAGTVQGRRRQGEIVVDEIARYVAGRPLAHAVTPELLTRTG